MNEQQQQIERAKKIHENQDRDKCGRKKQKKKREKNKQRDSPDERYLSALVELKLVKFFTIALVFIFHAHCIRLENLLR